MNGRDPQTREEWQEAVNAAYFCRCLADCFMYGLITDPGVKVARADELLARGEVRGILPTITTDDVARAMREQGVK